MPYVKEATRKYLIHAPEPQNPGELNYVITKLCLAYVNGHPRYQDYNDVVGALECAKLEFYRRAIVPYEEKKIKENGDLY